MLWTILLCALLLDLITIPHMLLARKRPVETLAWLWSILLFPILGVLAYVAIGTDRIKRHRLRRMHAARQSGPARATLAAVDLLKYEAAKTSLFFTLSNINQIPISTVRNARVLVDAVTFYPALLERIAAARHHIHIEFFIWMPDEVGVEFRDALTAAARRGVKVRLLLDQVGCFGLSTHFFDPLVEAGGKFSWFYSLPFNRRLRFLNLRNHRKLQIIDGEIAFVGGMNIGKEHLGQAEWPSLWRDVQIEVEGDAVAYLQEVFATDWCFASEERILGDEYYTCGTSEGRNLCQIISGGPDLPREPVPKSLVTLLTSAQRQVWISTGYFVPDTLLLSALQICGSRGVDVRLIISSETEHQWLLEIGRSHYEDLIPFGVRIFEFSKGVNHAKSVLLDDEWLSIGSTNFDNRSMRLNFELSLFLHFPEGAAVLRRMMEEDFAASVEITATDIASRPFARRLREAALRPLAPML